MIKLVSATLCIMGSLWSLVSPLVLPRPGLLMTGLAWLGLLSRVLKGLTGRLKTPGGLSGR